MLFPRAGEPDGLEPSHPAAMHRAQEALRKRKKYKEKQEAAKPTQVAAKPTHTATPIISNQAEFDTWFQSMMSAGPGNLKVVNPMIAPRFMMRGGCARARGGSWSRMIALTCSPSRW